MKQSVWQNVLVARRLLDAGVKLTDEAKLPDLTK